MADGARDPRLELLKFGKLKSYLKTTKSFEEDVRHDRPSEWACTLTVCARACACAPIRTPQELWAAASVIELLALAEARVVSVTPLLDELEIGAFRAPSHQGSPESASSSKAANALLGSVPQEGALIYARSSPTLATGQVYKDVAAQKQKQTAEAKAKEEVLSRAAAREAAMLADGGIEASMAKVVQRRKKDEG